jgi:acyl-CoA thioester hydrolase
VSSFTSRVQLRWVDLDAQGHVNNAVVADYLQEARVEWLLAGPNAHLLGDSTMVVGHQIEYLGPISFSTEPVRVDLSMGAVGASRFVLAYSVLQDEHEVARGRSTLCLFDYRANRVRRMTGAERSWFAAQSEPLEPLAPLGRWHVGEQAHEYEFTVRWSDLDSYGHVNNVRVFDYIAEARVQMNPDPDGPHRMEVAAADGMVWMVARQDVDYLGQILLRPEPYVVRTAIGRVGRTSVTTVAEVVDPLDSRVLVRTRTVVVSGDLQGRPVPVPQIMHDGAQLWPAVAH